jgi:hypothetical protein
MSKNKPLKVPLELKVQNLYLFLTVSLFINLFCLPKTCKQLIVLLFHTTNHKLVCSVLVCYLILSAKE